jgi:hypothetical protein
MRTKIPPNQGYIPVLNTILLIIWNLLGGFLFNCILMQLQLKKPAGKALLIEKTAGKGAMATRFSRMR